MKKYAAEFIGTFALVFCGTGAIIIDQQTNGAVTHPGIAATFGLIVLAMIYTFGQTSGAHLNPAVTIGFAFTERFQKKEVLPYVISQIAGAFLATFILKLLFPENSNLGATIPAGSNMQSFVLELILTYLLMLVIIHVSQGSKEVGVPAGIAIGATVMLESMFAGPVSGASMNPARSISPAILSGNLTSLWIYVVAPVLGALFATLTWKYMNRSLPAKT
jgi:aquaporin Z